MDELFLSLIIGCAIFTIVVLTCVCICAARCFTPTPAPSRLVDKNITGNSSYNKWFPNLPPASKLSPYRYPSTIKKERPKSLVSASYVSAATERSYKTGSTISNQTRSSFIAAEESTPLPLEHSEYNNHPNISTPHSFYRQKPIFMSTAIKPNSHQPNGTSLLFREVIDCSDDPCSGNTTQFQSRLDPGRRPVLLPRYASTDDDSPTCFLLDDANI